jgi:hypothetical protein
MPCVYTSLTGLCEGQASPSKREHYLPRALGNFQGDERLADRICDSCQGRFSQLEEVFARNSAEAFFREMVGRVGRKNHAGKNIFYEPTLGIPPLAVLGRAPGQDFETLWELVGEDKCQPMSQLVFIGKENRSWPLAFRRGVFTLDRIRTLLRERDLEATQIVAISNNDGEAEEMKALTDELLPEAKEDHLEPVKDGVQMEGEMQAAISPPYLRAIAKVGFHFVLQHFSQFSGLEPEFDEIKRFIYLGEATRRVVEPLSEPFVRELQLGSRMNRWGHLLSAEVRETGIEARMQFFAGPRVNPIVWRVLIGRKPGLISYEQSVGYGYLYFDEVGGEYQGERVDLTPIERILISGRPMLRYFRR